MLSSARIGAPQAGQWEPGQDDRFPARKPVDEDVDEAAHDEPEEPGGDAPEDARRSRTGVVIRPGLEPKPDHPATTTRSRADTETADPA